MSADTKRRRPTKKNPTFLGKLADPAPEGWSRETIESYLVQVETQLKLVKTLVDAYPSYDDAIKVQHLIQEQLKVLAERADVCIAEWSSSADEVARQQKLVSTEPEKPREEGKDGGSSLRWTSEEIARFNKAVEEIDYQQRGATKRIQERVRTKTVIQVRDRLRRYKVREKGYGGATPYSGN